MLEILIPAIISIVSLGVAITVAIGNRTKRMEDKIDLKISDSIPANLEERLRFLRSATSSATRSQSTRSRTALLTCHGVGRRVWSAARGHVPTPWLEPTVHSKI